MTESPKTKLIIAKAPKAYKLNPKKLKGASQGILPFVCGAFYYTEDYEYFDVIKPYLDIPEPRKSLEEIKQELDEKFEGLIEMTKRRFAYSKEDTERRYNTKFDQILDNFEYAKKYGYFPPTITLNYCREVSLNNIINTNYVLKPNATGAGYWGIQPNIQVWLKQKPTWIVRKCAKIFFDFTWKGA
jgi:hypothetical protein